MIGAIAALTLTGCARFDDAASSPFTPEPTFDPGAEVQPESPAAPSSAAEPTIPDDPCFDPDPNVVATCLDTTSGLVLLPGGSALVAERRTGRILRVAPQQQPAEIARIPVDGATDGGLLDIALSPTFDEDHLIYAYVTTPSDNRVVRIAPGDIPKDVLTGIPRGAGGNAGALAFATPNELMVLTGDAGDPAAATDPGSLAGKLLKVTSLTSNPNPPRPAVVLSGIGTAGDVCIDPRGAIWVTDRTAVEDRLQRVRADGTVGAPAWTWPDKPGVAGCAAGPGAVAVALTDGQAMALLEIERDTGTVTSAPALLAENAYGRLGAAAIDADGRIWSATVNKAGGQPVPTDDRVVKLPMSSGGGGPD
nr:PQQ-dependent sugar dehydrogenase [Prescottella sp. R16]